MSNKIIETVDSKVLSNIKLNNKIKRDKFFLYSGALAFGMLALSKFPFNMFKKDHTETSSKNRSIKITQNPNAVKRNARQENNG